jgi:type IV pilus assembly protein PilY1
MKKLAWMKPFTLTLLLLFCATTGHADDTEIYYKSSGGGNANILFLLDTSGSMAWCADAYETPSSHDPDCPADGSKVRMNILKSVFGQLIDGMGSNINVGLGTFSPSPWTGEGGYIVYPVRNLDAAAGDLYADSTVSVGNDDGYETRSPDPGAATYDSAGIYFPSNSAAHFGTGLIFRKLQIPSYATITSATMTVNAMEDSSTPLTMLGFYSVGADLPDLSQQDINSRTWGPSTISGPGAALLGVPLNVSNNWSANSFPSMDVTQLVQDAISDSNWCGNDDLMLYFRNKDYNDASAREIGTVETIGDNGTGYSPAKLHVEWTINPTLPAGAQSCNGNMNRGMGDNTDDAEQDSDGSVNTGGNTITLAKDTLGGFRFPGLNFAGDDTIVKAILHLPGAGSTGYQNVCEYYQNTNWRGDPYWIGPVTDLNSPAPDPTFSCGDDIDQTQQQWERVCTRYYWWGGCRDYDWQLVTVTTTYHTGGVPQQGDLPVGTNVTLHVSVVRGDAAAITSTNNDISGRTVLASEDYTVPGDDASFSKTMDLDVTSLAQQAISTANGWSANDALMFVVTIPTLPDDSDEFYITAQDRSGEGATITFTVESDSQTEYVQLVRDQLKAAVNGLVPDGGTPLAESYTEMARYLMGDGTYFGNGNHHPTSNPQSTVDEKGVTYESPIAPANQSCSANAIIVMTDGEANSDGEAQTQVYNIMGGKKCTDNDSYGCMKKLSGWLNLASGNTVNRQVKTDLVGFYLDNSTLKQMQTVSDAGEGVTLGADDASSLLAAFQSIINSVISTNASMAAPGVAVNQLNRLQYLNELYYAVFKPKNISVWPGNLKKYGLGGTAESPVIQDVNGKAATDPNTGFFVNTAQSYWSSEVDGPEVDVGGAQEVLSKSAGGRNLFVTQAAGSAGTDPAAITPPATTSLTHVTAWDTITDPTEYGLPTSATDSQRKTLFDWVMTAWGDPLHSEPQLINYGYRGSSASAAAADPSLQNNAVFVSDNDGFLRAINANTGEELFAFSPIEELKKDTVRQSIESNGSPSLNPTTHHRTTYGLDSSWTFWRRGDTSDASTVSTVYAYGGQRRGGSNYYALDVSQLDFTGIGTSQPSLLWQISGGAAAASDSPFSLLGQTWSVPQLAKVRISGKDIPVLVFSGGYDPQNDNGAIDKQSDGTTNGDTIGNAIYIVNAYTGALIWYASDAATKLGTGSYGYTQNADMKWSMPASVSVVDANGDGYLDFIYAVDTGGQIFRVDLNNFANTGPSTLVAKVKTVAKLGVSNSATLADNRRFFSAPTVALGKRNGNAVLQLVVGSGYRAHPLSEDTEEWVYGIDDTDALQALTSLADPNDGTEDGVGTAQPTLTPDKLADVTGKDTTDQGTIDASIDDSTLYGWRLKLDQSIGEKSLSEAAIIQGTAIFTTFTDESTQVDNCTSVAGGARLYAVNVNDGLAAVDQDGKSFFGDDVTTLVNGRAISINVPGIPPKPQVLLTNLPQTTPPSNVNPLCGMMATSLTGVVGTSAINFGTVNQCGLQRTGWYQSSPTDVTNLFNKAGAQ